MNPQIKEQIQILVNKYRNNPVLFVKEMLKADPSAEQEYMLNSVRDNQATAVKSGHGVGKTTTLAWLILWFLFTRPYPKIPCTAPTMHQLKDILWQEIAKWLNQNKILKSVFKWNAERVLMTENWFAVARTSTNTDAMQGFHGDNLLFIIDEASGIDNKIFGPILGALTGEGTKLIMVGNPTKNEGFFHDAFTVNRSKFNCITLDARNCKRVSKEFIQLIIDLYGEDSDPFRVRVAGEFPHAEADTFIPINIIEKSVKSNPVGKVISIHVGVDVARYGDDESTIYLFFQRTDGYEEVESITLQHNNIVELVGKIKQLIRKYNFMEEYKNILIYVNIDGGGLGAGVVDLLDEDHNDLKYIVNEKAFGGSGGELTDEPMQYTNDTGLMWGNVKRLLIANKLKLIEDNELFSQLTNRKYKVDEDGKIQLERKQDMKKRGVRSPDRADGVVLALSTNIKESIGMLDY